MGWRQSFRAICYVTIFASGLHLPIAYSQDQAKQHVSIEYPRSWNLSEIAKATLPLGTEDSVYVLAWAIEEDASRVRIERCLVMKVLEEDDGCGRWCLANLVRCPGDEKSDWRSPMVHVAGDIDEGDPGEWHFGGTRFETKPGNKELYAALPGPDCMWSFGQDKGWSFVGCGVCEETWLAVFGERPTRFFGR